MHQPSKAAKHFYLAYRYFFFACILFLSSLYSHSAVANNYCSNTTHLNFTQPLALTAEERRFIDSLPPIEITAVANGPPLTDYNPHTQSFSGIGVDIFCFIANQMQLNYKWLPMEEKNLAEKLEAVKNKEVDMIMSLSQQMSRDEYAIFAASFYQTHYLLLANKNRTLDFKSDADISKYRVGIYEGSAGAKEIHHLIPQENLRLFHTSEPAENLYKALRNNEIDILIQNKIFFMEHRYKYQLADVDAVHTLNQYPRNYGFYFSDKENNKQLASIFERYLTSLDISNSINAHQLGNQLISENLTETKSHFCLKTCLFWAGIIFTGVLAIFILHTRRKQLKLNQKLQELSQTDNLTDLANRHFFMQELANQYQQQNFPVSVLLLDLDFFKSVNDIYGHTLGDEYLVRVAQVLQDYTKTLGGLAARYGGKEFAVLLPATHEEKAKQTAENLRGVISTLELEHKGSSYGRLTVSIGLATALAEQLDAQQLLLTADNNLRQAKEQGANRVI